MWLKKLNKPRSILLVLINCQLFQNKTFLRKIWANVSAFYFPGCVNFILILHFSPACHVQLITISSNLIWAGTKYKSMKLATWLDGKKNSPGPHYLACWPATGWSCTIQRAACSQARAPSTSRRATARAATEARTIYFFWGGRGRQEDLDNVVAIFVVFQWMKHCSLFGTLIINYNKTAAIWDSLC